MDGCETKWFEEEGEHVACFGDVCDGVVTGATRGAVAERGSDDCSL